jgi:hypothetical protein
MSITGAGLGINCNTPQFMMDVNGTVAINTNGTGQLSLTNTSNTSNVIFKNNGNNFYILLGTSNTSSWNDLRPFQINMASGFVGVGRLPSYQLDVHGPAVYTPASGATARLTTPSTTGYALSNLTTSTYNGTSSIQMASLQLTYDGLSNYGANIAGGIQHYQGGILSLGVMADSTNVTEVMRSTPAGTWFPASGGVQISGSNALNIQVPGSIFMAGSAAGINGFIYSRRSDSSIGSVANLATAFGASNFTIEFWVQPTYTSAYTSLAIFSTGVPGTSEIRIAQSITASNTPGFVIGTTTVQGTANAMVSNVWYHMALVRNGNVFTLYINGVSNAGSTITGFTFANAGTILMGTFDGGANYYTGFIGNVRIVNGTALYTSNFTPPVGTLQFVAGTSLLMNMFSSATATVDSANAALFALAGSATWSALSPNPSAYSFPLATFGSVGNIAQSVYYDTGSSNTGGVTRRLDINATTDYLIVNAPTLVTTSTFGTYITSAGLQIDATTGPTTLQSSNQSWTFRNTAGAGSNVVVVASNGAISNGTATYNRIGGNTLNNGRLGVNTTAPAGGFSMRFGADSVQDILASAWTSNWALFGPGAGTSNGAALGIGYSAARNASFINSLTPGTAWRDLSVIANNIYLSPVGTGVYIGPKGTAPNLPTAPAYMLDVTGTARITSNLGVGVAPIATAGSINITNSLYINGVDAIQQVYNMVEANLTLSGGGIVTWSGGIVSWTVRVIAIPIPASFGSAGYFDIGPASYNLNTDFSGYGAWTALYYTPTVGSTNTYSAVNVRSTGYSGGANQTVAQSTSILICVWNGDDNSLKWLPGPVHIPAGGYYNSATGQVSLVVQQF